MNMLIPIPRILIILVILSVFAGVPSAVTAQCESQKPGLISLGITDDLSTRQVISWRTDPGVTDGYAELVRDESGPNLEQKAKRLAAAAITKNDYGDEYTYFRVSLDSLEPDTRYVYRVGNGKCRSEWFQFKTAQKGDRPFSFVFISDVQHGIDSQYPRVIREAAAVAPQSSFYLFTGDLTNSATDKEFKAFFQAGSWLLASKPVAAIPDNHEYREDRQGVKNAELASFWRNMFAFPANSPRELNEMGSYYFDYQNTRFIMINNKDLLKKDRTAAYLKWLEQLLKENDRKWLIVAQHQPVVPITAHRKRGSFYDLVVPLYEKYGVDLVLTGHDHGYSRGGIELNGARKKSIKGPVYIVSVAGSGMYTPGYSPWYDRMGADLQLFQHIEMKDKSLNFKAYTATGHIYDEFEIRKGKAKKLFRELIPDYPEATDLPLNPRNKLTPEKVQEVEKLQKDYIRRQSSSRASR